VRLSSAAGGGQHLPELEGRLFVVGSQLEQPAERPLGASVLSPVDPEAGETSQDLRLGGVVAQSEVVLEHRPTEVARLLGGPSEGDVRLGVVHLAGVDASERLRRFAVSARPDQGFDLNDDVLESHLLAP